MAPAAALLTWLLLLRLGGASGLGAPPHASAPQEEGVETFPPAAPLAGGAAAGGAATRAGGGSPEDEEAVRRRLAQLENEVAFMRAQLKALVPTAGHGTEPEGSEQAAVEAATRGDSGQPNADPAATHGDTGQPGAGLAGLAGNAAAQPRSFEDIFHELLVGLAGLGSELVFELSLLAPLCTLAYLVSKGRLTLEHLKFPMGALADLRGNPCAPKLTRESLLAFRHACDEREEAPDHIHATVVVSACKDQELPMGPSLQRYDPPWRYGRSVGSLPSSQRRGEGPADASPESGSARSCARTAEDVAEGAAQVAGEAAAPERLDAEGSGHGEGERDPYPPREDAQQEGREEALLPEQSGQQQLEEEEEDPYPPQEEAQQEGQEESLLPEQSGQQQQLELEEEEEEKGEEDRTGHAAASPGPAPDSSLSSIEVAPSPMPAPSSGSSSTARVLTGLLQALSAARALAELLRAAGRSLAVSSRAEAGSEGCSGQSGHGPSDDEGAAKCAPARATAAAAPAQQARAGKAPAHGKKRGKGQARPAPPKKAAKDAPGDPGRPIRWPCSIPFTLAVAAMLAVVFAGRLHDWSKLDASRGEGGAAGSKEDALRDVTAARRQAVHDEKSSVSLQRALTELQDFQREAAAVIEKLPGTPEAARLGSFGSDAKALHQALQEVSSEEFPQVRAGYLQVMGTWQATLRRARSKAAGGGSCASGSKLAER